MGGALGGAVVTEQMKTIQVTEEEFEYLIRLRAELQRRRDAGSPVDRLPGGQRGADIAMGAVAGMAAYWLWEELMEDDGEEEEEAEEVAEAKAVAKAPRSRRSRTPRRTWRR